MVLKHVALVCSSEENSDKFYERLLGLDKNAPKILPGELSQQIFHLDSEYKIINYTGDDVHFEIFIDDRLDPRRNEKRIEHVCIEIKGLEAFLDRCRAVGVEIRRVPKGDKIITFIRDDDGNLFEMKEKG